MALPMLRFHYHVYYAPELRDDAFALHERVGAEKLAVEFRRFHEIPVGPHPTPMFSGEFNREAFADVVTFFMRNHGPHSVLIHPETESERVDHSVHALWLGKPMPIDYSKLSN